MGAQAVRFALEDAPPRLRCKKCDAELYRQHDGSSLARDIAHHRETTTQALAKLDELLLDGWRGYCRSVRIVVGGGLIREQVLAQLRYYRERGTVREYDEDGRNRGAIVAVLRS
jgi:hypothetical protein